MLQLLPGSPVETLPAVGGFKLHPSQWFTLTPTLPVVNVIPSVFIEDTPVTMLAVETVAPVWCDECAEETHPVPMSSALHGWITYPCHQRECSCCWEIGNVSEICPECSCVFDCCGCNQCGSCGSQGAFRTCPKCDECSSCCDCSHCSGGCSNLSAFECCGECQSCGCNCEPREEEEPYIASSCSCSECQGNRTRANRTRNPAPWVQRGDPMPESADLNVSEMIRTQAIVMGLDPVQSMADFYLCDYVATVVAQGFKYGTSLHNAGTRTAHMLRADAITLQRVVTARCDGLFRDYTFAAIGGEVRHHGDIRGQVPGGRESQWDYWYAMGECGDRQALTSDCVDLFGDGTWGGSYGGSKWATIAKTLRDRLSGKLDARTFVDRVFSLQHNGGSLLNKVQWPILNGAQRDCSYCTSIGNAHAAEAIDFAQLLGSASQDAVSLVRRLVSDFATFLPTGDRDRLQSIAAQLGWWADRDDSGGSEEAPASVLAGLFPQWHSGYASAVCVAKGLVCGSSGNWETITAHSPNAGIKGTYKCGACGEMVSSS